MVMRPKSMATVVVIFWSTPSVSSTDWPASLSSSSVRSGRISLTAPTRVVLPTPKPPATSIFSARAVGVAARGVGVLGDHRSLLSGVPATPASVRCTGARRQHHDNCGSIGRLGPLIAPCDRNTPVRCPGVSATGRMDRPMFDHLERPQPLDHLAEDPLVGQLRGRHRPADGDAAAFQQVAEEHPDHAHGQIGVRGEFGDRLGLRTAQVDQGPVLRARARCPRRLRARPCRA